MLIPLNDTGRHRKGRAAAAAPPKFSAKGVTKVKSHGVYELKPSIVAKSTQVTMTPSLGLHLTSPKNASLGLGKLESAEPCLSLINTL